MTSVFSAAYGRVIDRQNWRWAQSAQFRLLLGIVSVVGGVILTLTPFASLRVLVILIACGMLLNAFLPSSRAGTGKPAHRVLSIAARTAWCLGAAAVLLVPALTISFLTLILAAALVISGAVKLTQSLLARPDGWLADLCFAIAWIVFGIVAFTWPDLSVFALAAVFGVQLVLFGVENIARAVRALRDQRTRAAGDGRETLPGATSRGGRRWARPIAAGLVCALAFGSFWVSAKLSGTPQPDGFYAAPAHIPEEPGTLIRSEPFATDIPAGSAGWRILYSTTNADGSTAVASALVVAPSGIPDAPVIAWAHGTTGAATGCAPSLLEHPFEAGALLNADAVLAKGWAIVATDYAGLGTQGTHGYLVGEPAGRNVLDAVRAAQQLEAAHLGTKTTIWGHSQGGHAALWAGGLAAHYAPELDIVGVAALAPASDLPALLSGLTQTRVGSVFGAFMITAYADTYDDVTLGAYVRPGARILVDEYAQRCLTDPGTLASIATALLADGTVWRGDPVHGPLLERAAENTPTGLIDAPVFIGQGGGDTLVLPAVQTQFVADRCAAGQAIEYRTYPGLDHMGVVGDSSALPDDLIAWTADRFTGAEFAPTC
ncbi:DUF308 domain-containing protein [Leucobacter sp. cx-42]|uniref:lipase family protein n=1 Tax=unclassified Leucobacter TaxID=2621730 RepID=UPI00165E077F|nr:MULTISPECIES: lipase family protein [unclassified Leucobacter]MBC9954745.1 DUF308 domain-containing protein [Leucobacter sp. cx-42]